MKERIKRTACIALMFILFITSLVACDLPGEVIEKIEGYIVSIIKGEDITSIFIGDTADSDKESCEKIELDDKVCITDKNGDILSVDALTEGCKVLFIAVDDAIKELMIYSGFDTGELTHLLIVCN